MTCGLILRHYLHPAATFYLPAAALLLTVSPCPLSAPRPSPRLVGWGGGLVSLGPLGGELLLEPKLRLPQRVQRVLELHLRPRTHAHARTLTRHT